MAACLAAGAAAAQPLTIKQGWVTLANVLEVIAFDKPDILPHYGKSYIVTQTRFAGTSPELTAFATGEVDICTMAYSSFGAAVLNAHLDDMRIVADGFEDGFDDYLSTPYLVRNDGGIKTIADLKGKVFATNVVGAAVDIGARAVLKEHGLEAGRDYTVVEAPFPAMGPMLQQHKVDLITGTPPFVYEPAVAAIAHPLFRMKDAMGPSQMIVIVSRAGFLEKNRAALDDFFEDMVRGVHWMLDPANRAAVIAFVAKETKDPPKLFANYYLTKTDFYHQPDGIPNIDAFQRNIETQRRLGFLKQDIDVKKYVDLSFIDRAGKRVAARP
jgi:NitT/TauT family transport system substrate-binding protein